MTRAEHTAWVRPLAALDRGSLPDAGGKAANLGELIRAGFPVPAGFCVTTDAFAATARGIDGWDALIDAMAGARPDDARALAAAALRAREALARSAMPAQVAAACSRAYAALGARVAVAVRSSATAEDLPDASFAGQQDTYLNVVGEAALLDAVRRCWASLFTERAVAYRARAGIDPAGVRTAVVVQRMVAPRVAGVLFTADPVTGRRRRAVVDASPGLGEAVVSGAVNPDHFDVDPDTGRVLARRLGDKRVRIDAAAGGGTVRVATAGRDEACVRDDELAALAAMGARVEAHYGSPQDLEWAIDDGGALWLLQARPITTLYPLPEGAPAHDERDLRAYFSFSVAQGVLAPISPMGVQAFALIASGVARIVGVQPARSPVVQAAHRVFLDATTPLRSEPGRRVLAFLLPHGEARSAVIMHALTADPRLSIRPASRLAQIAFVLRFAVRTRIPPRVLAALIAPDRARRRGEAYVDRALALGAVAPDAGPAAQLDAVERMLVRGTPWVALGNAPVFMAGLLALALARRLLRDDASADEMETVTRGLPHNPTTEMDLALWALAERARAVPEAAAAVRTRSPTELAAQYHEGSLPAALQSGLADFLAVYGARGVAEIDVGVARWSDDASHVFGVLRNYLAHGPELTAPDVQFARAARDAEATVRALVERVAARGAWRGLLVAWALSRARALVGTRERPKFGVVQTLALARKRVRSVGASLVASGRLERADDALLLTLPELRAALAGDAPRALCDTRRASLAREATRRDLPRWLLSDGTTPRGAPDGPSPDGALLGTPASAGTVTARARVVLDPNGATLEPGEILVAPSTDPGWTPLFLTAGGLVMEMGGAMSHGAVVAREYGIPAVVGVAHATERIVTGQRVTVDGASGTVKVESAGK